MNNEEILNESEEAFSVSCRAYPAVGGGRTEAEALENFQDAIAKYLAAVDKLVKGQDVRE